MVIPSKPGWKPPSPPFPFTLDRIGGLYLRGSGGGGLKIKSCKIYMIKTPAFLIISRLKLD